MLLPWLLILASVAADQETNESAEDTTLKTTTLYPTNKTIDFSRIHRNFTESREEIKTTISADSSVKNDQNKKANFDGNTPKKEEVTTWSIEANYVQPKFVFSNADSQLEDKTSNNIYSHPKDLRSESIYDQPKYLKNASDYAQPKDKKSSDNPQDKVVESEDSSSTDSKEQQTVEKPNSKSKEKEFKPSPHLGSFFDEENLNLLKFSTSDPSLILGKKPASDFLGSKDYYVLNYKSPKNAYRDQLEAPYRFESSHFLTSNNWKTLDSKPTVESAVKVPAGGLYTHHNPFRDKPSSDQSDDDFVLGYHEDGREKENPVKKRSNPWKSLVQLMTAFLPVGLIISALTPSIITLQSTDNVPRLGQGHGPGGLASRRLDAEGLTALRGLSGLSEMPAISERCRRRLLCEIHAEENYLRSLTSRVRKHCYKLQCEDPHSLQRVLGWLLAHRGHPGSQGHQPHQSGQRYTDIVNYHHRSDDFT